MHSSKEVSGKLKRMLTGDFKTKDNKMNETTSTFIGNNPSMKQQLETLSGLIPHGGEKDSVKKYKPLPDVSINKDHQLQNATF